MKIRAIVVTGLYYIVSGLLLSFLLLHIYRKASILEDKIYGQVNFSNFVYFMTVIIYFFVKYLFIQILIYLLILEIMSLKKVYVKIYKEIEYCTINRKSKEEINIDDLYAIADYLFSQTFKFNESKLYIIISTIGLSFITVTFYFIIAFAFELVCHVRHMNNFKYVILITIWTFIFIIYFYFHYNKFLNIYRREKYIYIFLLMLYIVALFIKNNLFANFISKYFSPFRFEWLNRFIQQELNRSIVEYAGYIIDWALIQGIIISLLVYYDLGKKRQIKYEQKLKNIQKSHSAFVNVIKMIEEIEKDSEIKKLCLETGKCMQLYDKDCAKKLIEYHKKAIKNYLEIEKWGYNWIFEKYSLSILLDKEFFEMFFEKTKKNMCVCCKCKQIFYSNGDNIKLCENCRKNKNLII